MALDQNALDEIGREVKKFGQDSKAAHDELHKELKEVRGIAEDAKGQLEDTVLKERVEKFTTSIASKQEALEKAQKASDEAAKERAEKIETMLRRSSAGDLSGHGQDPEVKAAINFFEASAAEKGQLFVKDPITADNIDLDGYKAWAESFGKFLRVKDDRQIDHKALAVGSSPDGGYLVPTAQSSRIIEKVFETSPMRSLATVETIGTSELEVPIDYDEADAGWVGEEEDRTETTTPQVGVQRIPVHELHASPRATAKMLEDAAVNIESWLAGKVADRFSRVEAAAFINGNGVKKPRGILTYPTVTGVADPARGKVVQVASGDATSITADAIQEMPFAIKGSFLSGATWLMKRSTIQAVMLLKDGQGQYLWRPGLQAGVPSSLAGFAVNQADDMPAVAGGSLPIGFGNWSRAYTIVDRLGITTIRDNVTVKPFVIFYTRKRVGGDVVDTQAYSLMKIAA